MRFVFGSLAIGLLVAGCVGKSGKRVVPSNARVVKNHIIYSQARWVGDVHVDKPVLVTNTGSLSIMPGTRVFFDIPAPHKNAAEIPWLLVRGTLVAQAPAEYPISFYSARPGSTEVDKFEDMIQLENATEAHFRNCIFEGGPWALHVHDTPTFVEESVFANNYGGIRFQGDRVVVRGNTFTNNVIGIRCLKSSPVIEANSFTGNMTAIFFREGIVNPTLALNNFDNKEYDVKLGEAQTEDIIAKNNWWSAEATGILGERIFDAADSSGIGSVLTNPSLSAPWKNR